MVPKLSIIDSGDLSIMVCESRSGRTPMCIDGGRMQGVKAIVAMRLSRWMDNNSREPGH